MSKPRVSDLGMLVDLLAGVDTGRRVFGAVMHDYQRGPALKDAEVRTVEEDLGITLPDAFRVFVTTVGADGAGPYYGLLGITPTDEVHEDKPAPRPDRPFPWTKQSPYTEPCAPGGHRLDGTLVLADQGCGERSLLVVTGPAAGTVWTDHSSHEGPLVPEAADFLTWYRRWLDHAFMEWALKAMPMVVWSAALASPAGGAEIPAAVRALVRPLLAASKDAEAQLSLGYLELLDGADAAADAAFMAAADAVNLGLGLGHRVDTIEAQARLHLARACARFLRGDLDAALAEVDAGLALPKIWASTTHELRIARERLLRDVGRHEDALVELDEITAGSHFDPAPHHRLARIHLAAGDIAAAIRVLERGARYDNVLKRVSTLPERVEALFTPVIASLGAGEAADQLAAHAAQLRGGGVTKDANGRLWHNPHTSVGISGFGWHPDTGELKVYYREADTFEPVLLNDVSAEQWQQLISGEESVGQLVTQMTLDPAHAPPV
ncbi:hypothetical protein ACPPVO_23355 [Dactylosporangium sp. McL0621]|uniref:hypothetical protein n=1 Tax=Dactylosporangium sp. McL0621 TaxID=3415678 RepID=UPI003CEEDB0C